jgi:hypothetical protein
MPRRWCHYFPLNSCYANISSVQRIKTIGTESDWRSMHLSGMIVRRKGDAHRTDCICMQGAVTGRAGAVDEGGFRSSSVLMFSIIGPLLLTVD